MRCLCIRIQSAALSIVLYSVAGLAAATLPFDRTSPVIYDNDGAVESGYTDVYIMALASAGVIDLRGIISTGTNGEQPPFIPRPEDHMLLERRELIAKARRSGLRNLPEPSPGPGVSMSSRRPASGRIEDTPAFGAQGSWLIVTEARKATPAKPLVVVMGGQGSAVADAYLLDNSIANKVVVAWLVGGRRTSNGILDGFEYNAYVDSWATYIIFERLRVVAFPVDDAEAVPSTPKSRLTELPDTEIRQYMLESRWPRVQGFSEPNNDWDVMGAIALTRSDFALVTKQMSFSHWEADRWGGPYQIPVWREDPNGRAMVVWQADAAVATEEWWSRIKDPAAWGTPAGAIPLNGTPWPVPGTVEAENFDHGGTNVAYLDTTNNWSDVAWFTEIRFLEHVDILPSSKASGGYMIDSAVAGEWTRYSIAVGNTNSYTLEVGVASNGSGGTFHVEFNGVDKTGPINVPNTGGWDSWIVVRKSGISLSAGPQVMRLVMDTNGSTGEVGNFDYLRLTAFSTGPVVTVVATDPTAAEAGRETGTFTVTRTGHTSVPLIVTYTIGGSATNGLDYGALTGTLAFQAGQSSATIAVVPVDDNLAEGSETVVLSVVATLSSLDSYTVGAQASATVTIADDDAPVVTIAATDAAAAEAALDPGWFAVSRAGSLVADLVVNYTIGGTATNGVDYQTLASSITIPAGQPSAAIIVIPIDDSAAEGNETVLLTLTANAGYSIGSLNSAIVIIADNGATNITAAPASIAASGTVTATWSGIVNPTSTDWFALSTPNSAAGSYQDWSYVSCTKGVGTPRASGSCPLTLSASLAATTYELRLFAANGVTRLATSNLFAVTGALPVVTIVTTDSTATELGQTTGSFTVNRDGLIAAALPVNYSVSGTASNGADYQLLTGAVTIAANQTSSIILVTPIDDSALEGDETVIVNLSANVAYSIGAPASAALTIADNNGTSITASIAANGTVTAAWSGISNSTSTDWIGLSAIGAANHVYHDWIYVSCTKGAGAAGAAGSCPLTLPASPVASTYELRLFAANGYTRLATSNSFAVTGPMPVVPDNNGTTLAVNPSTVVRGFDATASWSGIVNPSATDWIGLYTVGSPNFPFWAWEYVSCTRTASAARVSGSCAFPIPVNPPAGNFEIRLFGNNGFNRLATSNPLTVQ